jgi:esterase/lipase
MAIIAGIVAIIFSYHGLATQQAKQLDAKIPRDPITGIIEGGAPRWLGPEDSDVAVLFVHGFVGVGNNFSELPERMADAGYRVREMLLPGHGTSPIEFADTPRDSFLSAVLEEVHQLKQHHEKVFMVSHSMGGALTTLAAATEDLDGIILGAPYYKVSYKWYYILPVETWVKLTSPFVKWTYKSDGFIRVKRQEAKQQIISYRWIPAKGSKTLNHLGKLAFDPATLGDITEPVLMLVSTGDNAADPKSAEKAFDKMSSEDKTLITLENSDHHIYWDHDREEVYQHCLEFVDKLAR